MLPHHCGENATPQDFATARDFMAATRAHRCCEWSWFRQRFVIAIPSALSQLDFRVPRLGTPSRATQNRVEILDLFERSTTSSTKSWHPQFQVCQSTCGRGRSLVFGVGISTLLSFTVAGKARGARCAHWSFSVARGGKVDVYFRSTPTAPGLCDEVATTLSTAPAACIRMQDIRDDPTWL